MPPARRRQPDRHVLRRPPQPIAQIHPTLPAEGRVEFLIFDAFNIAKGPIAKLPLKHMIHAGFHTSFEFE